MLTDSISEYKLEFNRKSIQSFPVLSPEILTSMKLHSVVFSPLALPHFFIKRGKFLFYSDHTDPFSSPSTKSAVFCSHSFPPLKFR